MTNKYVLYKDCTDRCGSITEKLNQLAIGMATVQAKVTELEKHFNDSLDASIKKKLQEQASFLNLRNSIVIVFMSAIVSIAMNILF